MRNCSDDCEQYHCPKCGGHTMGWLDTFEMCQSCEIKLEQTIPEDTRFYPKEIDNGLEGLEDVQHEADLSHYDDDPSPYDGNYSEE